MSVLGVVLARGGSKRVPRKNIRPLGGQPLIAWTIGTAMLAQRLDDLVVSSDDEEILEIAGALGVRTIKRPDEMARDDATSYPSLLHAVDSMPDRYDYACLLPPTSPLRISQDIDCAIWLSHMGGWPAVASFAHCSNVPNGAVYVGRVDWLKDGGDFDGPAVGRYYMAPSRSIDIDTEADFAEAERRMMEIEAA